MAIFQGMILYRDITAGCQHPGIMIPCVNVPAAGRAQGVIYYDKSVAFPLSSNTPMLIGPNWTLQTLDIPSHIGPR